MTARDRKLLVILAPLAVFALYWLLLMNPALDRQAALEEPLAEAQAEHDATVAEAAQLQAAEDNYRSDYAELVKLSKAIPQSVAASDLMRELNAAARGTGISFTNITMTTGDPEANAATEATSTTTTDTSTDPAAAPTSSGPAGLEEIPVELTFDGRFFDLADLFRRIQQFVTLADGRLEIHGRLIRIDGFSFDSASFPNITAKVQASIYAAPAEEGPTDGATPVGPRGAERGDGGLAPVENFSPATAVGP